MIELDLHEEPLNAPENAEKLVKLMIVNRSKLVVLTTVSMSIHNL
jgi:hypothetical protein